MEFHKLSRFPPSFQPFNYLLCCILYVVRVDHIIATLVHVQTMGKPSEKANMFVVIDLNAIFNGRLLQVWWAKMYIKYIRIRTRTRTRRIWFDMTRKYDGESWERNFCQTLEFCRICTAIMMPEQFPSTNCQWSTLCELSFR